MQSGAVLHKVRGLQELRAQDSHQQLINAVLIVVSVFLGSLIIVLMKAQIDPIRTSVNLHSFQKEEYLFDSDDVVGFKPRANVHVTAYAGSSQFDIYTDSRGGRVDRLSTDVNEHADIVGIGGSQTWGFGVQNEDTFLSVLSRGLGFSVSNLSVSGFGGVGSYLRLRENVDLSPRLVIYGLWEDHLNRNIKRCLEDASPVCLERPYYQLNQQRELALVLPSHSASNIEQMRRFYLETSSTTDVYRSIWSDMYWVSYDLVNRISTLWSKSEAVEFDFRDKWQVMRYVIEEMNNLISTVNAKLVVVWIPLYFSSDIHHSPNELEALSLDEGFILVDLSDRFLSMQERGVDLALQGDGHMNEHTHRIVAEEVFSRLRGSLDIQ